MVDEKEENTGAENWDELIPGCALGSISDVIVSVLAFGIMMPPSAVAWWLFEVNHQAVGWRCTLACGCKRRR